MVHKLLLCLLANLGMIILTNTSTAIIDIHWFKRLAGAGIISVRRLRTLNLRDRLHLVVSVSLFHLLDATLAVETTPNDLIRLHKLIQLLLKVVIL